MAKKNHIGTTFKESDVPVAGPYVDNVVSKRDVQKFKEVINAGVDELYSAVDSNVAVKPMMGGEDCYQYVGNLEDLPKLKHEITDSRNTLDWAEIRAKLNVEKSVDAMKRAVKSCAIGFGASALSAIMTAGYWIEAQKTFENFGTYSPGEPLVATALMAAGALGYALLSGYRAIKAGKAVNRENDMLKSVHKAQHDVTGVEIIVTKAELENARREKYRKEFGESLKEIDKGFGR